MQFTYTGTQRGVPGLLLASSDLVVTNVFSAAATAHIGLTFVTLLLLRWLRRGLVPAASCFCRSIVAVQGSDENSSCD